MGRRSENKSIVSRLRLLTRWILVIFPFACGVAWTGPTQWICLSFFGSGFNLLSLFLTSVFFFSKLIGSIFDPLVSGFNSCGCRFEPLVPVLTLGHGVFHWICARMSGSWFQSTLPHSAALSCSTSSRSGPGAFKALSCFPCDWLMRYLLCVSIFALGQMKWWVSESPPTPSRTLPPTSPQTHTHYRYFSLAERLSLMMPAKNCSVSRSVVHVVS